MQVKGKKGTVTSNNTEKHHRVSPSNTVFKDGKQKKYNAKPQEPQRSCRAKLREPRSQEVGKRECRGGERYGTETRMLIKFK